MNGWKRMIEKKLRIRGEQVSVRLSGEDDLPVIVFLHGFTGATSTWTEIMDELAGRFKMIAVDLTGHGETSIPTSIDRYSMEAQLNDLEVVFKVLKVTNFTLVGYSMGGRIALGYTIKYPERVRTLILESASPGLKTEEERIARRLADEQLAKRIEAEGIDKFVTFWENIPLFESQKKLSVAQRQKVRKERLRQNEVGLANSLKGIGTGSQPSYWEQLKHIPLPVLLLTGELDEKFVSISREMKKTLPNAMQEIIQDVGHAIHVENPTLFATIIENHIKQVNNLGRQ